MSSNEKDCACSQAPKLIFPCSGASDTGEITDQSARQLARHGIGKMFCLAGIGGKVNAIVESTKSASKIIAIDGCVLDCAKKTLEQGGFNDFLHLRITDLGLQKGKSPATEENISVVYDKAIDMFH